MIVVAPAKEQSAVGLSITVRHPLHIEKVDWHFAEDADVWSVSGTPSDCIKLALSVILTQPPELIISGINRGGNAGRNVLYSGTVAGVIEGMMHDIPGMAISAADFTNPDYEKIEYYIPSLVQYILESPLPTGTFLNVNFPSRNTKEIKGVRLARQGRELWVENPEEREHPTERSRYYWLGAKLAHIEEADDSDIKLVKDG